MVVVAPELWRWYPAGLVGPSRVSPPIDGKTLMAGIFDPRNPVRCGHPLGNVSSQLDDAAKLA